MSISNLKDSSVNTVLSINLDKATSYNVDYHVTSPGIPAVDEWIPVDLQRFDNTCVVQVPAFTVLTTGTGSLTINFPPNTFTDLGMANSVNRQETGTVRVDGGTSEQFRASLDVSSDITTGSRLHIYSYHAASTWVIATSILVYSFNMIFLSNTT